METTRQQSVALVCSGLTQPGRTLVLELLRRNWRVVVQDDCPNPQQSAAELAEQADATDRIAVFAGPIDEEDRREQLVEYALEQWDALDLLVNSSPNEAAVTPQDLLEVDPLTVAESLREGMMGTLFLTQRVANEMIRMISSGAADGGKIVLLNSLAAYTTSIDQTLACLNAAGLAMLTKLFADRLGEYGINVYELRSGLMATSPTEAGHGKYETLIQQGLTPIRRWGRPADLAQAVAAVADDAFGFTTGEVFHVDGGFHLRRL